MIFLWRKRADVAQLIRFDRPYGTFLVMCPTLWSLLLASAGRPSAHHLVVFILGSFLMRSAGCVANDMADYKVDAQVARTRDRPLAAGRLTHAEAWVILAILLAFAFVLVCSLNATTFFLSFAALGVALFYPFAKRCTPLPQMILGIAFGFGVLMAWTAARGALTRTPILLFLANLCWTMGYDTLYAMMDRDDDRKIGIQSTAILFGSHCAAAIGLLYALGVVFLFWAGRAAHMGFLYNVALSGVAATFVQQVRRLQAGPSRDELFVLFKAHARVGGAVLVGILLGLPNAAGLPT